MSAGVLGVIQAGGRSTRYGAPKALAEVDGRRLVDRVHDALAAVVDEVVMVANDPQIRAAVAMASRPDVRPDAGPLGGILTALLWARELERPGALTVACDMPFVSPALLALLLDARDGADVVVPESDGPRGVEPLCAYYGVVGIAAIEQSLDAGDLRVVGFHDAVRVVRVPRPVIAAVGDPDRLFLNVNTVEEHAAAERVTRDASHG